MNQENKQLILPGPYKLDLTTTSIIGVRGEGQAIVGKFSSGIYNRKDITKVSYKQASAHAALMLEALQVLALTGKTPMEMHISLTKL